MVVGVFKHVICHGGQVSLDRHADSNGTRKELTSEGYAGRLREVSM